MVRKYKPKNRIYRYSKLPEEQVLRVLSLSLSLMPTRMMSQTLGISERTIRKIEGKYIDKLTDSQKVRSYHFEKLFEAGAISETVYFFLVNDFLKQDETHWPLLDRCVFHCPNLIYVQHDKKSLEGLFEKFQKKVSMPRTDAKNYSHLYPYMSGIMKQQRIPCGDCTYIQHGPLQEPYITAFFTHINLFFRQRKLRKKDIKRHYLFLFISFTCYVHAMKKLGIEWPYDRRKGLPNFDSQEAFLQALLSAYWDITDSVVLVCCEALISDPL